VTRPAEQGWASNGYNYADCFRANHCLVDSLRYPQNDLGVPFTEGKGLGHHRHFVRLGLASILVFGFASLWAGHGGVV
jgi:hypothetical protein